MKQFLVPLNPFYNLKLIIKTKFILDLYSKDPTGLIISTPYPSRQRPNNKSKTAIDIFLFLRGSRGAYLKGIKISELEFLILKDTSPTMYF